MSCTVWSPALQSIAKNNWPPVLLPPLPESCDEIGMDQQVQLITWPFPVTFFFFRWELKGLTHWSTVSIFDVTWAKNPETPRCSYPVSVIESLGLYVIMGKSAMATQAQSWRGRGLLRLWLSGLGPVSQLLSVMLFSWRWVLGLLSAS